MGYVEAVVREIEGAGSRIGDAAVGRLIDALRSHSRVFVYGTGRSGLMLKAFAMRCMQLGLTSYAVGETTTPSIQAGDLLVVASASGSTASVVQTAQAACEQGADLFCVTATPDSPLSDVREPDVIIDAATKHARSTASAQPLGSLFEQMLLVFFDAVILSLAEGDAGANDRMASRHASLE